LAKSKIFLSGVDMLTSKGFGVYHFLPNIIDYRKLWCTFAERVAVRWKRKANISQQY